MNTYHTTLKICYALNLQNQWIDKEIRDKIPSSTAAYWKNIKPEKIIGTEISREIEKNLSNIQASHHAINTVPLAVFNAYCQFTVMIANLFKDNGFRKILRENKEKIINTIDKLSEHIPYRKAARLLNVTEKTLYYWRTIVKFKCDASALLICAKRHPNQATIPEVNIIKDWLSQSEFAHWGIHSIWAKAFNEKATHLSKQSWYHYNKILGFRKFQKKGCKPKNNSALRAENINEIWHADITVFKTLDGIKYYIYTVMDNYSRYIHSWRIEKVVSAKIRLETIQEAIRNALSEKDNKSIHLVTDGGPENNNLTLKEFMAANSTCIHHSIALKDIVQSNSMMEAFYKTTKYVSLYNQKIENCLQLQSAFQKWIDEYHTLKPHYNLGIYTPLQILKGADKYQKFDVRMSNAAKDRREFNKNANCSQKCS